MGDVAPIRVCGGQGGGRWQGVGLSAGTQEQVTSRDPGRASKASGRVGAGRGGGGGIREREVQAGMQTVTSQRCPPPWRHCTLTALSALL